MAVLLGVGFGEADSTQPTTVTPAGEETSFDSYAVGGLPDTSGGFPWNGTNGATSIRDNIARVGNQCLRMRFAAGDTEPLADMRFTIPGQPREVWLEWWIYFPDGTEPNGSGGFINRYSHPDQTSTDNNKLLRLWGGDYDTTVSGISRNKVGLEMEKAATAGDSTVYPQATDAGGNSVLSYAGDSVNFVADVGSSAATCRRGRWAELRFHTKLSTASGANDGLLELWVDRTKILTKTGLNLWATGVNYFSQGYILGQHNSGYLVDTHIYVDVPVRLYTSDPGWT